MDFLLLLVLLVSAAFAAGGHMSFLLLLVVLVAAAFVSGMFFRDQVFSCFTNQWFKTTSSQEQRIWFAQHGHSFKTFPEARAAWYQVDSRDAKKDRERAEKRYAEFLRNIEHEQPASLQGKQE